VVIGQQRILNLRQQQPQFLALEPPVTLLRAVWTWREDDRQPCGLVRDADKT
jgi:hypothetical protein